MLQLLRLKIHFSPISSWDLFFCLTSWIFCSWELASCCGMVCVQSWMWTYIVMSGQRRQRDLLLHWATVELCEAQAAHRGWGMGDLGSPCAPAEVKLGAEPRLRGAVWWAGAAQGSGMAWQRTCACGLTAAAGPGSGPTWVAPVKANLHHRCFISKLL